MRLKAQERQKHDQVSCNMRFKETDSTDAVGKYPLKRTKTPLGTGNLLYRMVLSLNMVLPVTTTALKRTTPCQIPSTFLLVTRADFTWS